MTTCNFSHLVLLLLRQLYEVRKGEMSSCNDTSERHFLGSVMFQNTSVFCCPSSKQSPALFGTGLLFILYPLLVLLNQAKQHM